MRTTLDFTPLFRSGVGFDRVFDVLDTASRVPPLDDWPPYDIMKGGEDHYRIVMAVAGFEQDELMITDRPNLLIVSGAKKDDMQRAQDFVYLHRGIAAREFERRFELADYVKVARATLHDGLLTIDLKRDVPEALKPRCIEIRSEGSSGAKAERKLESRQIEAPKAA